ncbi:hypothetical protein HBA55_19990 [Pseudomaricurvus alkylphenolicus]|uniref:hypothetical protein n=1 Tax=Pseudomaricurvus alkylphenolicus TaxID=1306991 RepID=UPI00141FF95E|nr:hypothetical protein [Pseudomaricurvus alkylphenolicus]NIB41897.1 hypothetical protein [Pseudomaricurvus alkylphenolicus]
MILLLSILFSTLLCLVVVGVLIWVRTPHYRLDEAQVARLLEWMLLGQATENDWRVFCDIPIRHDDFLESIRIRCVELDEKHFIGDSHGGRLLSAEGLEQLTELLQQIRTRQSNS